MDAVSQQLLKQANVTSKLYWCLSFVKNGKYYLAYVTRTAWYILVCLVKGKEESRQGAQGASCEIALSELQKLIIEARK